MMFWMHQPTTGCASIPASTTDDDALYAWVATVTRLPVYTDQTLEAFTPYFYQLGTQLGYAQFSAPHLEGLLRHPGIQQIRTSVPREIPLRFQPSAMADIDRWVRRQGNSLMFVNGENDIAVAEHFSPDTGACDSFLFNVPDSNHHISITRLRPNDADQAIAALRRWTGQAGTAVR